MSVALPASLSNQFLCDLRVYDVDDEHGLQLTDSPLDRLVAQSVLSASPEISDPSDECADFKSAIAVPVFRGKSLVSVVAMATGGDADSIGVFEIWSPVGAHEELSLSQGYFGNLARFKNVSSFVRFEKGSGLPGQVWDRECGVIHDELSNHPGFLRAAGASADDLSIATGIPVIHDSFMASVLLISSQASPIAKGFEIWVVKENEFALDSAAYHISELAIDIGEKQSLTNSLPGLAHEKRGAVIAENKEMLAACRPNASGSTSGLVIPCYRSDTLTSVAVLLF